MVAGIFLRFGIDLVNSLGDAAVAVPMVVVFFVLAIVLRGWGQRMPPILGALLVGGDRRGPSRDDSIPNRDGLVRRPGATDTAVVAGRR